jgi:3-oxoacyl-[acyl-carrier protein] reductase
MDLQNYHTIVTGAASGMGRCFAHELASEGASVMAADVDEEGLEALADELDGSLETGRLETVVCDVTEPESVERAVEATVEAFGAVNGVVNNAGIFRDGLLVKKDRETGDVSTMSLEEWQSVIDVDLTGPFLFARAVAAWMLDHPQALENQGLEQGVIINISSVSRHGNQGQGNYSAAKAGLVADTKLWAEELARYDIRVGAIAPGFIETPILDGMPDAMREKMISGVPLGRAGKPEEIFQALKFIVECDYFTGRCVDVDGGVTV